MSALLEPRFRFIVRTREPLTRPGSLTEILCAGSEPAHIRKTNKAELAYNAVRFARLRAVTHDSWRADSFLSSPMVNV